LELAFILTKSTTPVIGWIANLLGYIMDWLFNLTSSWGIGNIALCIILFTIIVNVLMLPLTIKQQKSSKIMNIMQPEINAIQKKYKGKQDQASQQKMQAETQAVYQKYGYSMSGGCVQLIIQMPILFALYQVIYRIPAYITQIYEELAKVANAVMGAGFADKVADLVEATKLTKTFDASSLDSVIEFLYKLTPEQWTDFSNRFGNLDIIETVSAWLIEANTFLGINLATTPWQGFKPSWAWLIPILAGVTQWLSVKFMTPPNKNKKAEDDENPTAATMKSMNTTMPIISVVFCFTLPAGIGIYWIASAVVRTVIQLIINLSLKDVDPDVIVQKNLEKVNAKRAKKGLPPKTIDKNAILKAEREEQKALEEEAKKEARKQASDEKVIESNKYYNFDAAENSITARANMVAMMDKRNAEKKNKKKEKVAEEQVAEKAVAEETDAEGQNNE